MEKSALKEMSRTDLSQKIKSINTEIAELKIQPRLKSISKPHKIGQLKKERAVLTSALKVK